MRTITNYDEIMAAYYYSGTSYKTSIRVRIDGTNYTEQQIMALSTSHSLFNTSKQQAGCAVGGEITLKMLYPEKEFPKMAKMVVSVQISNATLSTPWFEKGTFFIDTRERTINDIGQSVLTIHGYDSMLKAEADFPVKKIEEYPAEDIDVVNVIGEKIIGGSTQADYLDSRTVLILNKHYMIDNPKDYTMREVLEYIAAMYGGNFIITDENKLRLVTLNEIPKETRLLVTELDDHIVFGIGTSGVRILV